MGEPKIITLPRMFQGNCWNLDCPDSIMFSFSVAVERGGLRCRRCNYLNVYSWSDLEFRETKKAYNQEGD